MVKSPIEAWGTKSFEKREGVAEWPLFCRVDTSTQSLKVRSQMYMSVQLFGRKEHDVNPSYVMTLMDVVILEI